MGNDNTTFLILNNCGYIFFKKVYSSSRKLFKMWNIFVRNHGGKMKTVRILILHDCKYQEVIQKLSA